MSLSVASTVVLMRALQERHLVETERGHIVVGLLVVQDRRTLRVACWLSGEFKKIRAGH
jgi:CPA2 family monovalent cation:H+ antiporter-2